MLFFNLYIGKWRIETMAYNETYTNDDMGVIAIDGLAAFGVVFVQLATVIALVVLFVYLKKKLK